MQPLPFDQFSNSYTVLSQLGRGASGICYHITTPSDRRHYALKKIPLHLVEPQKLTAELTLLSSVQHPNLIRLQHSFISRDFLYLLFDYHQQRDLQKLIKERDRVDQRFEETEIWAFLRQLLMALAYLHGLGILHRDVKPSNVFVDLEGALQLGDLGSAKLGERENYTRVGTPLYLAPEIIKYEAYSEKVDIWSLGVTLYQLAALRPPFQHPNFLKLAQSITYEEPQYPVYFSRRLKACIAEMLRKDPKERPSAQDLLERYFIAPVETPPEVQRTPQSSLHSVALEVPEQAEQTARDQSESLWNVELSGIRAPERLESRLSIQRSSTDEEPPQGHVPSPRVSSIKTLGRASSNRLGSREDEIRENSNCLSRTQLQDSDETIVLQVNPNDCTNFCGYYRESPRPSRIHFGPSDSGNSFRMGRKSSLFKHAPEPQMQNPSQFKTNHLFKQNHSGVRVQGSHRRQESVIGAKQKHGELMSGLRPSRHGRDEEEGREVGRPELIVIDLKPLLMPWPDVIEQ